MTKAIIFDFGNVIARFDNDIFLQYLSSHTDKNPEELKKLIYPVQEITLPKKYETGLVTSSEFYNEIEKLTDAHISEELFKEIYTQDKFWPIPSTIGLIRDLRKKGYKIGLLSNTSELDYELGMKPIFRRARIEFDSESLSFQVRAMKPLRDIYFHALENLNLPGGECVYIDDIKGYVTRAEELGMKGVHCENPENLERELTAFL